VVVGNTVVVPWRVRAIGVAHGRWRAIHVIEACASMLVYIHKTRTNESVVGLYDGSASRKFQVALESNLDDSFALNKHRATG
jgi:hypothetical protein